MIRFVDVRFQGLQARFALWDTVESVFIMLDGTEAWTTFAELEKDAAYLSKAPEFLERVRALCPPWVDQPPTDEELDFREEPPADGPRCTISEEGNPMTDNALGMRDLQRLDQLATCNAVAPVVESRSAREPNE